MKRRTPLCGVVGAVPGALPPVTGWVAATDSFGAGAWALFAILFLWQLPHSLAIAQLYASDYARAGFRLLPIVDRDGHSTERQIVINCVALLAVGLMPTLLGLAGPAVLRRRLSARRRVSRLRARFGAAGRRGPRRAGSWSPR